MKNMGGVRFGVGGWIGIPRLRRGCEIGMHCSRVILIGVDIYLYLGIYTLHEILVLDPWMLGMLGGWVVQFAPTQYLEWHCAHLGGKTDIQD